MCDNAENLLQELPRTLCSLSTADDLFDPTIRNKQRT